MRDGQTIEEELVEIGAIADDSIKLERIIAWCATYPDEVPFAIRFLLGREKDKDQGEQSRRTKHRPATAALSKLLFRQAIFGLLREF